MWVAEKQFPETMYYRVSGYRQVLIVNDLCFIGKPTTNPVLGLVTLCKKKLMVFC